MILFIIYINTSFSQIKNTTDTFCNELVDIGTISFKNKSFKLSNKAKTKLDSIVAFLKNNINCDLYFVSHASDFCDKCDVLSWDRTTSVISYLNNNGISNDRLQPNNILDGNFNYINLSFAPHLPELNIKYPRLTLSIFQRFWKIFPIINF